MHVKVRKRLSLGVTLTRAVTLGLTGRGFRHGTEPPPSGMLPLNPGRSGFTGPADTGTRHRGRVMFPGGRRRESQLCVRLRRYGNSLPQQASALAIFTSDDRADPVIPSLHRRGSCPLAYTPAREEMAGFRARSQGGLRRAEAG
jgi:hypothetical protein